MDEIKNEIYTLMLSEPIEATNQEELAFKLFRRLNITLDDALEAVRDMGYDGILYQSEADNFTTYRVR